MARSNDFDTYQEWALTKMSDATAQDTVQGLLTAALGTTGESGELLEEMLPAIIAALAVKSSSFADSVKKVVFHGHPITDELRAKLAKELGDQLWYVAIGARALGLQLSAVAQGNIDKLDARYPGGFTSERSQNRTFEGHNLSGNPAHSMTHIREVEGAASGIGEPMARVVGGVRGTRSDRSEYPNGFAIPQPPKQMEARASINPDDPRHGYGPIADGRSVDPNERQAEDVRRTLERVRAPYVGGVVPPNPQTEVRPAMDQDGVAESEVQTPLTSEGDNDLE